MIDTQHSYIGAVERGEQNLTLLTLEKIAQALRVDFRELLEYQGLPGHSRKLLEIVELLKGKNEADLKRVNIILQQFFVE